MKVKVKWITGVLLFPLAVAALHSQDLQEMLDQTLRVDVDLVLISVTVTDSENRYVTSLKPEHFRVFEDRIEQRIEYFSAEEVPLSLGIIFDVSGSMEDKAPIARDAAATFLGTGSAVDEYFLLQFDDRPELVEGFTTDVSRLGNHLLFSQAEGSTALYDAVYLGLQEVAGGTNAKKALLTITDGQDNHSRYTFGDVREFVRESDVQIYSIGIVDGWGPQQPLVYSGWAALKELSETTGGRAFFPDSVYELEDIASKIAVELKNQYVIGYFSSNESADGEWRDVRVRMEPPRGMPQLSVRAKKGYYAPIQ